MLQCHCIIGQLEVIDFVIATLITSKLLETPINLEALLIQQFAEFDVVIEAAIYQGLCALD